MPVLNECNSKFWGFQLHWGLSKHTCFFNPLILIYWPNHHLHHCLVLHIIMLGELIVARLFTPEHNNINTLSEVELAQYNCPLTLTGSRSMVISLLPPPQSSSQSLDGPVGSWSTGLSALSLPPLLDDGMLPWRTCEDCLDWNNYWNPCLLQPFWVFKSMSQWLVSLFLIWFLCQHIQSQYKGVSKVRLTSPLHHLVWRLINNMDMQMTMKRMKMEKV